MGVFNNSSKIVLFRPSTIALTDWAYTDKAATQNVNCSWLYSLTLVCESQKSSLAKGCNIPQWHIGPFFSKTKKSDARIAKP